MKHIWSICYKYGDCVVELKSRLVVDLLRQCRQNNMVAAQTTKFELCKGWKFVPGDSFIRSFEPGQNHRVRRYLPSTYSFAKKKDWYQDISTFLAISFPFLAISFQHRTMNDTDIFKLLQSVNQP